MAVVAVIFALALFTCLGYAMIATTSLQAEVAGNLTNASEAEYLAEAGIQLSMYYLQYPSSAPSKGANGVYNGQTGISFGSAVPGTADVAIASGANGNYIVTATGYAGPTLSNRVAHKSTATVHVNYQFQENYAASFANGVLLPANSTISGNLQTNGDLSAVSLTARINGNVTARTTLIPLYIVTGTTTYLSNSQTVTVPTASTLRNYTYSYVYNGKTYSPTKLWTNSLTGVSLPRSSDLATNPAGVYWYDSMVDINDNNTINGTLIVTSGGVRLKGKNNFITPSSGLPALVCYDDFLINGNNRAITVNGLMWVGGGLTGSGGLLDYLTINGALIVVGSPPYQNNLLLNTTVNYTSANVKVGDFSSVGATVTGVQLQNWTP